MPKPTTNPYRPDRAVIGGMERHRAWDQGYAAAQADTAAWLASDEAVERVARALAIAQATHYRDAVCEDGDAEWWEIDEEQAVQVYGNAPVEARAVLAALRGDET